MAIVRAVKTGVWSDVTTWNTGALPTSADNVYSNTFTVTIDTSPTVLSISNAATTGVTAGGTFAPTNGITLTCTGAGLVGANLLINYQLASPSTATINAAVPEPNPGLSGGTVIVHSGSGTLNIVGNITGPIGWNSQTIGFSGAGVLNITGTITGGSSTGNICPAILVSGVGTLNVTGSIRGSSTVSTNNGMAINVTGNGLCNVTGALNSFVAPAIVATSGSLNIIGNVAVSGSAVAVTYSGTGSLTVSGSCTPANNFVAITSSSTSAVVTFSGPFLVSANGTHAVYCPNWKWASTTPPATYYQIRSANLSVIRPLYTADSVGGNPAVDNVRSGTVYGPSSELTGTCAVPAADSVASGVPVGATTGTAVITAATLRSAMGLASANLDTQLAAIPTTAAPSASTIASAVWSATTRTITDTIPTAADIATAVWAAATRTLTTAIDNSTTIATAVWGYASGRTVTGGTVDTASNAPSAATIASATRAELAAELARIDVATSTRLAPAGTLAVVTTLTNSPTVPTAAQIASATRTELAPELARVANCATVESTGDQIVSLIP